MSKNQEQMKELINDVRTGKTDKEVLCKEIQKDVNCLIYPVFGEDYKKLSPRAIIDICTNLDSIDVDKNIMRQIATRVSVFMFNLIDNSTIKIDDDYEYEYGRIKEDKELFDIIKDNSRIFKDFKAYDNAPDNIKSLSRVQTIMMELYGYEMHSVDEIETLLDIDSAFILKLIAMMKDNILGISSVVENMSDYASFDEEETDDSDIKIYGAEQKAAETEAADEYEAYEPENADLPDNESDEGIENDESDDEDSDEGVLFEYDMNGNRWNIQPKHLRRLRQVRIVQLQHTHLELQQQKALAAGKRQQQLMREQLPRIRIINQQEETTAIIPHQVETKAQISHQVETKAQISHQVEMKAEIISQQAEMTVAIHQRVEILQQITNKHIIYNRYFKEGLL